MLLFLDLQSKALYLQLREGLIFFEKRSYFWCPETEPESQVYEDGAHLHLHVWLCSVNVGNPIFPLYSSSPLSPNFQL